MDVSTSKEQLSLQAGSCTAAFYPEMALSQLIETFSIAEYNTEGIRTLENLLVGLQVRITYDKARKDKVKTIKSIGRLPQDIKFVDKEGNGSTDVIAHFEHSEFLQNFMLMIQADIFIRMGSENRETATTYCQPWLLEGRKRV